MAETMRRRARKGGGRQVELTIEAVGGRGDGYAGFEGRPLFVPLTVPGDRVRARITSQAAAGFRGELIELIEPSPSRVAPPCPHFGACGGCSLQMIAESAYVAWKEALVDRALAQASLVPDRRAPLIRIPQRTRRRVGLAMRRLGNKVEIGYRERSSHRVVPVQSCLLLRPALDALLQPLAALLRDIAPRDTNIVAAECDNGIDLALRGLDAPDFSTRERLVAFAEQQDLARLSLLDEEAYSEPLVIRRRPTVTFGDIPVAIPPGVFLQASKAGEQALVAKITQELGDGEGGIAELFSGAGSFTFPLARFGKVDAFEGDDVAFQALNSAVRANNLAGRIRAERRDLYRRPLRADELAGYDAVVFDPPRAGAKEQAVEIAASGIRLVAAVSCNPATFARDLRLLAGGGYRLIEVTAVDQFIWSPHVEVVGVLRRSGG